MRYHPETAPDPAAWLSIDGEERIEAALHWHMTHCPRSEPETGWPLHASLHAQVETRVAQGQLEAAKLKELMGGGMSRHDSVHAVADVLLQIMVNVTREGAEATGGEALLRDLTADSWHQRHHDSRADRAEAARRRRSARRAKAKARKRSRHPPR